MEQEYAIVIHKKRFVLTKEQYDLYLELLHENIKLRNMLDIIQKELARSTDTGNFSLS